MITHWCPAEENIRGNGWTNALRDERSFFYLTLSALRSANNRGTVRLVPMLIAFQLCREPWFHPYMRKCVGFISVLWRSFHSFKTLSCASVIPSLKRACVCVCVCGRWIQMLRKVTWSRSVCRFDAKMRNPCACFCEWNYYRRTLHPTICDSKVHSPLRTRDNTSNLQFNVFICWFWSLPYFAIIVFTYKRQDWEY